MIYMFLSNNPSSGDINSSNLPCSLYDTYTTLRSYIWRLNHYLCNIAMEVIKKLYKIR